MAFPPQSPQRSLHPHDLHLHLCKLKKALTCTICYRLLQKPACLHCNHHFCMSCLLQSMEEMSACPKCKQPAVTRHARFAPEMDALVNIYQSLEASVGLVSGFHDGATPVVANSDDSQLDKLLEIKNMAFNVQMEDDCLSPSATKRQRRHENRERVSNLNMDATEAESRKRDASSVEVPCRGILPASKRIQLACPPLPADRNEMVSGNLDRINTTSNTHSTLDTASMKFDASASLGHLKEPVFAHATIGGQTRAKGSTVFPNENKVDLQAFEFFQHEQPNLCGSALGKRNNHAVSHFNDLEQERIKVEPSPLGPHDPRSQEETQPGNVQDRQVEKSAMHEVLPSQADQDAEQVTCAFCHKSDSQVAGPIIHYKKGVPVSGSKRTGQVFSVHKNCAEWAPGVYYEDDVAKNIPQEVARGHKIKCHVCGLRGAVLGCYVKRCRKSFHYPCAHTLSCRWDDGNFLVFCPEHVTSRFPDEDAKGSHSKPVYGTDLSHEEEKQSQPLFVNECRLQNTDAVKTFTFQQNNAATVETFTPTHAEIKEEPLKKWPASKWVLCSSGLSPKANELLATFVSYTGLTYEKMWTPSVTHLITGTDEVGAARRTLKYLMANLEGRWILKVDWLSACMAAERYVSEEPYEVNLDIHGMIGGPRRARGMAIAKAHKLFEGLRFYFLGEFVAAYRADLQALVAAAGGMVFSRMPDGSERDKACIVLIYNKDMHPHTSASHRGELNKSRYLEAKSSAAGVGARVAGHTWILDSVASYDLQPFE